MDSIFNIFLGTLQTLMHEKPRLSPILKNLYRDTSVLKLELYLSLPRLSKCSGGVLMSLHKSFGSCTGTILFTEEALLLPLVYKAVRGYKVISVWCNIRLLDGWPIIV